MLCVDLQYIIYQNIVIVHRYQQLIYSHIEWKLKVFKSQKMRKIENIVNFLC
ncbi:hypothetical protein FHS10_003295 [Mucilaginibacter dorajii]|nr:hypothetical protein [Mucilaginibacter dorajii]